MIEKFMKFLRPKKRVHILHDISGNGNYLRNENKHSCPTVKYPAWFMVVYYVSLILGGGFLLWLFWWAFAISCVLSGYPVEVCGL